MWMMSSVFPIHYLSILIVLLMFTPLIASLTLVNRNALSTFNVRSPGFLDISHSSVYNTTAEEIRQGWVSGPDGRGTLSIFWSSLATIFLCSWTVLCLNVMPRHWSKSRTYWQKFCMAGLGAVGPEIVLQVALAQWNSACRSVKAFHSLGHKGWTMKHAFLADMGGFNFHTDDGTPFPLDAEQVFYLIKEGYVDVSDVLVDKRVIDDKNKGDKVARFLTVCQILWFTINSISRLIQHLAITTLELTTLGFIICTLGTYFFWAEKPMDILIPITLVPNTTLAKILERAGSEAPAMYKRTPLDFVGRSECTTWMLYWTYWMNMLRKLGIVFHPANRPIHKISDDYLPAISSGNLFLLFFFHTGYAAVHIAGWNFHFPTQAETTAWHVATIIVMASICGCWAADVWTWTLWPLIKKQFVKAHRAGAVLPPENEEPKLPENSVPSSPLLAPPKNSLTRYTTTKTIHSWLANMKTTITRVTSRLRNNSLDDDPNLTVPLKAMIPITIFGATYTLARAYILIEDLLSLRSQPASAFETTDWANFLPHL